MKKILRAAAASSLALAPLLASSSAHADTDSAEPLAVEPAAPPASASTPSTPATRTTAEGDDTVWYGYQPLVADGIATVLTAAGVFAALSEIGPLDLCLSGNSADCPSSPPRDHTASTALLTSGVVTYALASPIIHAVHGNWAKAGSSLGLRAAPVLLALPLLASGQDGTQRVGAGVLVIGVAAAIVIDDVLLAREPAKIDAKERKAPATALSFAPTFDVKSRAGGLAAAGTF